MWRNGIINLIIRGILIVDVCGRVLKFSNLAWTFYVSETCGFNRELAECVGFRKRRVDY